MDTGIKITGIDTLFGGISWEFIEADRPGIQELLFFLEAKRLLVSPIEMEIKSRCEQSAIGIKNKLAQLLSQYSFNAEAIETTRRMVSACNIFLDDLNKVSEQGIIYKSSSGDWANASSSIAMEKFRNISREKTSWFSNKHQIEFVKEIPEEY